MKTRIVNILAHKPDYDYLQDKPRPAINWDTPNGDWVGIYRNEIPDKLGEEVLKYTPEFEYEVWQPDYRADKIYSHRFEDGLVHRLFPAEDVQNWHGIKLKKDISSPGMVDFLLEYAQEHPVIINLNGDFGELNFEVLERCGELPILQTFRGTLHLPGNLIFKPRLNLPAAFSYLRKHLKVKDLIDRIDYVMVQNELYIDDLKKMYTGPVLKLTSGCEFDVWQPMDKQQARQALGLPADKPVLFTSSLLIPIKQLDKLLQVLKELSAGHDFLLLISGHGTEEYEAYLQEEARELLEQDKVRFVGYLTGKSLQQHYCAADAFVHVSVTEGGPVAAMKAIACETPILMSEVGNVAEELRNKKVGKLIDPYNYGEWKEALKALIQGEKIAAYPREEGKRLYDWQAVAKKFVEVYRLLEPKARKYQQEKAEVLSSTR